MHPNDEIMRYYEPEKIIDTKYTVKEFIESLEQKGLLSQIDNTTFLDNIAKQHNPDSHYSTFSTVTYDSYTEDGKTYNSRLIIIRSDDGTDILLPGLFLGDNKRARKENLGLCITIDKDLEQSTFQIDESGVLTPVDARNEILEEIHKAQEILIKEDPYEIELRKDLAQRLHAQYVGMFGDNPSTFAKMSDNEYVLIDREGNTIRDNIYRYKPFSEGLAVVGTKDGWGYLKPDGTILYTKVKFYEADSFSEGLAVVKTENGWGYLNTDGTILHTEVKIYKADSFSDGVAQVTSDGMRLFIDHSGNKVF